MTKVLSEDAVIFRLARATVDRTVAAVVAQLDAMDYGLSGDDSPLESAWEEICVQVQHQRSFSWDDYDQTVRDLIRAELVHLQDFELAAIWYRTHEGVEWACADPDKREEDVFIEDAVVQDISEALYAFAMYVERDTISQYLENT